MRKPKRTDYLSLFNFHVPDELVALYPNPEFQPWALELLKELKELEPECNASIQYQNRTQVKEALTGKKLVNKDGVIKFVDESDIPQYLAEGWSRGRKPKNQ